MDDSFVTLRRLKPKELWRCCVRRCHQWAAWEVSLGQGLVGEDQLHTCQRHYLDVIKHEREMERIETNLLIVHLNTAEGKCDWPSCHSRARYLALCGKSVSLRSCRKHEMRIGSFLLEITEPNVRESREPGLTWGLEGVRLDTYGKMELQDLCADRGLPTSGTIAKLRANLEAFRKDARKLIL
mmetsp:Transcript_36002/g.101364  ORF Transcript_36002/g.101364 Transcript_36002/m.101364 type:complete len:183 (+) Transcript_36002:82-630(+)